MSRSTSPNLCFIGAGYVGLVSAAGFAARGFDVICADIDKTKIARLKEGCLPFFEPGLEDRVRGAVHAGRLTFVDDVMQAASDADIAFVTVGTPAMSDGRADVSQVMAAVRMIAPVLKVGAVVALKSTVPVGTCRRVGQLIVALAPDAAIAVASVPEFLREGAAVADFDRPDRIVIGASDGDARAAMTALYKSFEADGVPVIVTDENTAELVKYASNAFLATKVSYINEMANLCSALGADIDDLIDALGSDKRIGRSFLNPGPGYGGSCFPKDAAALTAVAHEAGAPVRIVESVIASNAHHVRALADRILTAFGETWGTDTNGPPPGERTIAVLGLAFKANTDDVRWSSSLVVIPALMARGVAVRAYDPRARDNAASEMPDVTYCASADEAMQDSDGVVILTEWDEFRTLDWKKAKTLLAEPVIFDARNLCDPAAIRKLGFSYHALGRR